MTSTPDVAPVDDDQDNLPIPDYDPSVHIDAKFAFGGGILGSFLVLPTDDSPVARAAARERHLLLSRKQAFPALCRHLDVDPNYAQAQWQVLARLLGISCSEPDYVERVIANVAGEKLSPSRAPFYFFAPAKRGVKAKVETKNREREHAALVKSELRKAAFSGLRPNLEDAYDFVSKATQVPTQTIKMHFHAQTPDYERRIMRSGAGQFLQFELWKHNCLTPLDALRNDFQQNGIAPWVEIVTIDQTEESILGRILSSRLSATVCQSNQVIWERLPATQKRFLEALGTAVSRQQKEIGIFWRRSVGEDPKRDSFWQDRAVALSVVLSQCGFAVTVDSCDFLPVENLSPIIALCWARSAPTQLPAFLQTDDFPARPPFLRGGVGLPVLGPSRRFRNKDGSWYELPSLNASNLPQRRSESSRRRGVAVDREALGRKPPTPPIGRT